MFKLKSEKISYKQHYTNAGSCIEIYGSYHETKIVKSDADGDIQGRDI